MIPVGFSKRDGLVDHGRKKRDHKDMAAVPI